MSTQGCKEEKKNPTLNISIYLHSNPLICILLNVLCTLLMQRILTANICSLQSKGNWEPKTLRNCVWVTRLSPCLGYCDYWHSKYSGSKGNLSKNNDKSFPFWKYSKLSKFSINSTCNISRSHNFHWLIVAHGKLHITRNFYMENLLKASSLLSTTFIMLPWNLFHFLHLWNPNRNE